MGFFGNFIDRILGRKKKNVSSRIPLTFAEKRKLVVLKKAIMNLDLKQEREMGLEKEKKEIYFNYFKNMIASSSVPTRTDVLNEAVKYAKSSNTVALARMLGTGLIDKKKTNKPNKEVYKPVENINEAKKRLKRKKRKIGWLCIKPGISLYII